MEKKKFGNGKILIHQVNKNVYNLNEICGQSFGENKRISSKPIISIKIMHLAHNKGIIKLFGKEFVMNNKDKCYILYEGKKYKLTEYFHIKSNKKGIINIKLVVIENLTSLKNMFYNCSSLISIQGISNLNTNNVTDMSSLFYNCSSLISLPDISNWNTSNVTDMSGLFYNCSSLKSLPDISNWNTSNVRNMSFYFIIVHL